MKAKNQNWKESSLSTNLTDMEAQGGKKRKNKPTSNASTDIFQLLECTLVFGVEWYCQAGAKPKFMPSLMLFPSQSI